MGDVCFAEVGHGFADEAEVEDLDDVVDPASLGGEDVRGFDVAMDEPLGVRFAQGGAGLMEVMNRAVGRENAILADELVEAHAREQFHSIVKGAVVALAVVVDGDDVPVGEGGGGADLAFKSCEDGLVTRLVGADEFDSAGAFEKSVLSLVDFAHSAFSEFIFELVLAELFCLECFAAHGVDNVGADHG